MKCTNPRVNGAWVIPEEPIYITKKPKVLTTKPKEVTYSNKYGTFTKPAREQNDD